MLEFKMSIARGNLIGKSFFHLQFGRDLLPWLERSSAVRCSKDRRYGSSMLVKYIPKKIREVEKSEGFPCSETHVPSMQNLSRKAEESEHSLCSGASNDGKLCSSSSNLSRQEIGDRWRRACDSGNSWEKVSTRSQMSFDNLHTNSKPDSDEEVGYDVELMDSRTMEELKKNDDESEVCSASVQIDKQKALNIRLDAEKLTVRLLAARAYTAMELRKKLHAKRFPPNIVDAVLRDFRERGMLSDGLYAELYSQSRWSSSCWGPRRIKQALVKKGVNRAEADNAVKLVFEGGEDGEQPLQLGISKSSMDRLYEQASKQWLRAQDVPKDTRKGRITRWLQYRGFDWAIVSAILKRLEAQHSP